MSPKTVFRGIRKNIILSVASFCFIASLSYAIHVIWLQQNGGILTEAVDPAAIRQQNQALLFVILQLSISGFLLMVILYGTLLNFHRSARERQKVWSVLESRMHAVESADDGIAILDAQGLYSFMNTAHAACYGYDSAQELIGKNWRILYDNARLKIFENEIFPILAASGSWKGKTEGRRKDGTVFPQEISLSLLEDGGLICVVRDISEKVRNEILLKIIKLAVEAADDGIAICDMDNKLLFMNSRFLKIHGYDPAQRESYLGTDWRFLYNEKGQAQINSMILPGMILKGSWSGFMTVKKNDGGIFYADTSITKLPDGLVLGVVRDITERRQVEVEKEALKEQLFHSTKMEAIGRITNGIAHDFDKIVSSWDKSARILQRSLAHEEKLQEQADILVEAADRAAELVDQLLAFSRKGEAKTGLIDIAENLLYVGESLRKNLTPQVDAISDVRIQDAYTHANPRQITQILMNLANNAADAMAGRRGKIALSLREADRNILGLQNYMVVGDVPDRDAAAMTRLRQEGVKYYLMTGFLLKGRSYLHLSVSDTGGGIAPDILAHIFDPFFTTKPMGSGSGLGLSTVHGVMIGMSGAIIVETVPEEGTCVHLFFPRADVFECRMTQARKVVSKDIF